MTTDATLKPLRVLVVDDDPIVRSGVTGILRTQPDITVVGEHGDGVGLADVVHECRPDVVLIDVRMPGVDGVEAVSRTRRDGGPAFLMMTAFDEEGRVVEALEAGAAGFILKDEAPLDIVRAVRAAASGDAPLSARSAKQVRRWLTDSSTIETRRRASEKLEVLTEKERQIALALVDGPSDAELAAQFHLSESSIKSPFGNIKTKWNVRNRTQIAVTTALSGETTSR